MKTLKIAALAAILGLAATGAHAADAAAGKKVFNKCKACHVVDSDKKKVGPTLQGFLGRNLASVEGFKYSKVFQENADQVWTEELFDAFITAPRKKFKGTKMAFGGVKKEADRANLLAYLKENGACPESGCPAATN